MAKKTTVNINKTYFITKIDAKTLETNLIPNKGTIQIVEGQDMHYAAILRIYNWYQTDYATGKISAEAGNIILSRMYGILQMSESDIDERLLTSDMTVDENAEAIAQKLIDLLAELGIDVSIRMFDTLARATDKVAYLLSYYKLSDHPAYNELYTKIQGSEWRTFLKKFNVTAKTEPVNKHLKIYFGPAGTGKTYTAEKEADTVILCSADMTCKDLLQDFDFEDGKATFKKSDLWIAIEEGKTVLLDEINLLNKDTLQFLQGLTDGKESINFLGNIIKIHPNFKVIGTMNLVVNGMKFPLPEPLVDRCSEIIEYKLTAKDLLRSLGQ